MKYNERIRAVREDRDMTQTEVAKIIGVAQSYYSKQERGNKPFQVEQIKLLCEFFGVSADYILGLPRGLSWERD